MTASVAPAREFPAGFDLVVEYSASATVLVDAQGKIVLANQLAASLFGYSIGELIGSPAEHLLALRYRGESGGFGMQGEMAALRQDGLEVPVDVRLRAVDSDHDEFALISMLNLTERKRAEERFRLVLETAPSGRVMVDRKGLITLVNSRTEAIFGYSREELVGRPLEMLVPERMRQGHARLRQGFLAKPNGRSMGSGRDLVGLRKDGSEVDIEIGLSALRIEDEDFVLASIIDITERKRAEERKEVEIALRKSEQSLRMLAEALPNVVWTAKPDGAVTYFNKRWYEETGLTPADDADYDKRKNLFFEEDIAQYRAALEEGFQKGTDIEVQVRRFNVKDQGYRWQLLRLSPVFDDKGTLIQWIGSSTDIHAQKESEAALERAVVARTAELQQALAEKTVLLKEVHHRVKNNLTVIASLLSRKAEATDDPAGKASLEDSRRRVHAMALVHEHLYGAEKLDRINFGLYLKELSQELHQSMPAHDRVAVMVEADDVELSVHRAIPCCLILTELLTNALKYGFPGNQTGSVEVKLEPVGRDHLLLSVKDDGAGMPTGSDWRKSKSLGLRIVQILTKQLDGSLELVNDGGCEFRLTFPSRREAHEVITNL